MTRRAFARPRMIAEAGLLGSGLSGYLDYLKRSKPGESDPFRFLPSEMRNALDFIGSVKPRWWLGVNSGHLDAKLPAATYGKLMSAIDAVTTNAPQDVRLPGKHQNILYALRSTALKLQLQAQLRAKKEAARDMDRRAAPSGTANAQEPEDDTPSPVGIGDIDDSLFARRDGPATLEELGEEAHTRAASRDDYIYSNRAGKTAIYLQVLAQLVTGEEPQGDPERVLDAAGVPMDAVDRLLATAGLRRSRVNESSSITATGGLHRAMRNRSSRPHYTLTNEQQWLLGRMLEETSKLPNGLRELPPGLDVPDEGMSPAELEAHTGATGGIPIHPNGILDFTAKEANTHSDEMLRTNLHRYFPPSGNWAIAPDSQKLTPGQAHYFLKGLSALMKFVASKGVPGGSTLPKPYDMLQKRLSARLANDRGPAVYSAGGGTASRGPGDEMKRARQLAGVEQPRDGGEGEDPFEFPVPRPVSDEEASRKIPLDDGPDEPFFGQGEDGDDEEFAPLFAGKEDDEWDDEVPQGGGQDYEYPTPRPVSDEEANERIPLAGGPAKQFFGKPAKKPRVSTTRWQAIAAQVEATRRNLQHDEIYAKHLKTLTAKKAYFIKHLKAEMGLSPGEDLPIPKSRMAGLWNLAGLGRKSRGNPLELAEWLDDLRGLVPAAGTASWDGRPEAGVLKEWVLDMHRIPEDVHRIIECWRGPKARLTPDAVVGILREEYLAAGRKVSEDGMRRAVGNAIRLIGESSHMPNGPDGDLVDYTADFPSLFWWVNAE